MAEKKEQITAQLERQYIIPLRKEWLKVPKYKRAKRAVKAIKQFIAKHMKVPERDIRKVKVDKWLNEEIWFRGIKKPPAKIKVKATKNNENIVKVELVDIPQVVKFKIDREKKSQEKAKLSEKEKAKQAEKEAEAKAKEKLEEKVKETEKAEVEEEEKREEEKKEILKEQKTRQKIEKIKEKGKPKEVSQKKVQKFRMALQK